MLGCWHPDRARKSSRKFPARSGISQDVDMNGAPDECGPQPPPPSNPIRFTQAPSSAEGGGMAERTARDLGRQLAWRSMIAGALLWATFALALRPSLPETSWRELELFFAVLVLVPIGLVLCVPATPTSTRAWHVACGMQPLAATVLILAWSGLPGPRAFMAALPWFALTSFCGFLALSRLRRRGIGPVGETCVDASLFSIALGGVWVVLARRSELPLDWIYTDMVAEAAYFHGVGFLLLLATGLASPRSTTSFVACSQLGVLLASVAVFCLRLNALLGPHAFVELTRGWADMLTMGACLACAGLQIRGALLVQAAMGVRILWGSSAVYLAVVGAHGLYKSLGSELSGALQAPGFVLESTLVLPGFALAALIAWNLARRSVPKA